MPKVDPTTGEPMSDAPEGDDVTRGGKERGDPGLEGATETGRSGVGYSDTGSEAQRTAPTAGSRPSRAAPPAAAARPAADRLSSADNQTTRHHI